MGSSLLSVSDLGPAGIGQLVRRSVEFASGRLDDQKPLTGRIVGIYFAGSSTRTRTSFTVASLRLGAQTIAYGPKDLQISTGETLEDSGRVLSGYLDALVVRTNGPVAEMQALSGGGRLPVINAMSAAEHPTQAIADLSTLHEHFGRLEGLHLLYVGEGNNSAAALALAFAQLPRMKCTLVTPEGYGLPAEVLAQADAYAQVSGSEVVHHHRVDQLPEAVDAVYATRWQTMGVEKADKNWKSIFRPYRVDDAMMARVSRDEGTIFMHDLPAVRGQDVVDSVLDGPQSVAWRQAEHKLFSAMAVLEWAIAGS
ncbi:MAG: ornithine carbamoyltransferase [Acidobacteriota bacterium]|nr:ornithine carbamoyltransferase [Acidobacteriota bacterium]